jgi:ribosomal protein S18 acetylase RimI-like enzyme
MEENNLTIRFADKADIPVIAALADKIWREHYSDIISVEQIGYMLEWMYSAEALTKAMDEGQKFLLAQFDNRPLGYLSYSTKDDKNYYIHKLYVDVMLHRKGIGKALLAYMLKQLPDAETIELAVNRMNYKAVNFYFRQGFTIKYSFDLEIGEGYYMNDYLMVLVVH